MTTETRPTNRRGSATPSWGPRINRRSFGKGAAAALGFALLPRQPALADVPATYDRSQTPPMDKRQDFIDWMVKNRGENPKYLGERFDRFKVLVANRDVRNDANKRAFLLTPREEFVRQPNLPRTYDNAFLDIGFGVTISGPHLVGRMTSAIDVQPGEKVLEIGTGSGYQSAYLSNLTDKVLSIEIIKPLAERTRATYDKLIERGYAEYQVDIDQERRRLLRLAGSGTVRQDHRHLRHRPHPAAAPAAAEAERHHGDPDRAAGRPARPQGHQAGGSRRHDDRGTVGHLQRPDRPVRAVHQARGRRHQRDPFWQLERIGGRLRRQRGFVEPSRLPRLGRGSRGKRRPAVARPRQCAGRLRLERLAADHFDCGLHCAG